MQHVLLLLCALGVEPADCTPETAIEQRVTPRMSRRQCEVAGERLAGALNAPDGQYYRIQCAPDEGTDPA